MGAPLKKQSWWHGCSSDELEQPVESIDRFEILLATKVVETLSTSPSTTFATLATLVACRRRQNNKQRES
jgi:hypothetical protein